MRERKKENARARECVCVCCKRECLGEGVQTVSYTHLSYNLFLHYQIFTCKMYQTDMNPRGKRNLSLIVAYKAYPVCPDDKHLDQQVLEVGYGTLIRPTSLCSLQTIAY